MRRLLVALTSAVSVVALTQVAGAMRAAEHRLSALLLPQKQ
jgi:hypothetical protein